MRPSHGTTARSEAPLRPRTTTSWPPARNVAREYASDLPAAPGDHDLHGVFLLASRLRRERPAIDDETRRAGHHDQWRAFGAVIRLRSVPKIVLETRPLGFPWETADPFLFCVHHDDALPRGQRARWARRRRSRGATSARTSRARTAGACTTASVVPGFPAAPAPRLRDGDHRAPRLHRSLRLARRDGALRPRRRAVAHRRRRHRPLRRCSRCSSATSPNPLELFQIWLNLPSAGQARRAALLDALERRRSRAATFTDEAGRTTEVTVIAGQLDGKRAPPPPPHSWAARARRRRRHLDHPDGAGRDVDAPAGRARGTNRTLYFFRGAVARASADERAPRRTRRSRCAATSRVDARGRRRRVRAAPARRAGPSASRWLQHGPFVMNTRAEIQQAFARLPAHAVRRLAVAQRRPGAPAGRAGASPGTPTAVSSNAERSRTEAT